MEKTSINRAGSTKTRKESFIPNKKAKNGVEIISIQSNEKPEAENDVKLMDLGLFEPECIISVKKGRKNEEIPDDFESHHPIGSVPEMSYVCQQCCKGFSKLQHLKMHLKFHSKEKTHTCTTCNMKFLMRAHLITHRAIHAKGGLPAIKCKVCPMSFAQRALLDAHMKKAHPGRHTEKKKPHKCEECGHSFAGVKDLIRHSRVHTGEKPYSCELCDKTFARDDYLLKHLRVHSGEKPYKCTLCNEKFAQRGTLVGHIRVHHGEAKSPPAKKKRYSNKRLAGGVKNILQVKIGKGAAGKETKAKKK